ncbi:MAG TPA: glycosyl hydrolase family 28-related protein [Candidatus Limnocylindrales bacterium]|nr:glycosyl hydrolase family 28-related protein [Candidatus Limnocylindrales bacterium]
MTTWKDAVRLATTGNVDLALPQTSIDGVIVVTGDRILVKDQTQATQNGIYVSASGSLARSNDTLEFEDAVRVSAGTANAHTQWVLTTQGAITVGTTALTFANHTDSVAADIARSGENNGAIDRVRGLRGVPIAGSDGALSMIGAVPTYNAVGAASYKLKKPSPPGWFDVTDYGAVGDGAADCTSAIQALINFAVATPGQSVVIYLPPGNFRCAGNLTITRSIILRGAGGALGSDSSYAASRLTFPAGKGVIVETQTAMPIPGGYADFCIIEGIQFVGAMLNLPAWTSATSKSVGALTKDVNNNRYYYEAIRKGTTGAAIPVFKNTYLPDFSLLWSEAAPAVPLGAQVRATVGINAATPVYFECTTAGTKSGSEPTWNTAIGATTTDGTVTWTARSAAGQWAVDGDATSGVVWRCRVAAGIFIRAHGVAVRECRFFQFTNAAVQIESQPAPAGHPASNANSFHLRDLRIVQCGVGVAVRGYDTSAGLAELVDVEASGLLWPGTGGVGIWDGGFTGSTWIACQVAASTGQGYIIGLFDLGAGQTTNPIGGVLVGCYMESDCLPPVGHGGTVIGGTWGQRWNAADGPVTLGIRGMQGDNNISTFDHTGPKHAFSQLNDQGWDRTFLSGNDDNPTPSFYMGLIYQAASLGRAGWWSWCHGAPGIAGRSFSGLTASEGPGWDWQPVGEFRGGRPGVFPGQYFVALDAATMRNPRVRKIGEWKIGDRCELQDDGAPGGWTGYIVKSAGYRGVTWKPNTSVKSVDQISIIEPVVNEAGIPSPGRRVFKCTTTGTTGAAEPTWPSSGTVTDGTAVWTFLGTVPEYSRIGFVDDLVIGYTPHTQLAWADTRDTDPTTAAADTAVRSWRFRATTNTTTANQLLATIPLQDQKAYVMDVTIVGGGGGDNAAVTGKLSGSFVRDGTTVTRLGTDDNAVKGNGGIAMSTFNLNISGSSIQVRATPSSIGNPIAWAVVVHLTEVGSLNLAP